MTEKTYDVAIVGASIAGCTAAALLAREGARVVLIERHSDPNAYKALCTHFIQPCAVPTMQRLGLLPLIEAAGAVPNEIDMWTRWGCIRSPEGAPYGYNIRRQTLDPLCHLFVAPIMVGGGKRSLPDGVRLKLELLDERRFSSGMVYLYYRTRNTR